MKTLGSTVRLGLISLLALLVLYQVLVGGFFFFAWFLKWLLGAVIWLAMGWGLGQISKKVALVYFLVTCAALGVYLIWIILRSFLFWSQTLLLLAVCLALLYAAWYTFNKLRDTRPRF